MNRIEYLRYQIERIRRFAATLTDVEDRERFQSAADDYQREIDALSSTDSTSGADMSAPSDAIAASGETDTAAPSDAIAASNDGDAILSTIDTGARETD